MSSQSKETSEMPRFIIEFRRTTSICKAIDAETMEDAVDMAGRLMESDFLFDIDEEFAFTGDCYEQLPLCQVEDDADCDEDYISPEEIASYIGG